MEIKVRNLQSEDSAELAKIEEDSFSMPWSEQDFRDLLSRSYCTYVVALADGKVAGCAGFTNICNEANIDNVVVASWARNHGIAKCMMAKLMELGEEQGVEAYTLEVRVSNAPAIHVYESFGFVSEGIRPNFYERPTEDANIMWKR